MPTFDLRQHIREVLAEIEDENLDILVDAVFARTPRANVREAYRQALTEAVRHELPIAPRPGQSQFAAQRGNAESGSSVAGEGHSPIDAHQAPTLPGGGNVRNSRVALLRRNRFRMSVWIGDKTYRHILECTRENLEFAAAESDRQARANEDTAARYRKLAKVMAEREVDTVAELTDDEIRQALADTVAEMTDDEIREALTNE